MDIAEQIKAVWSNLMAAMTAQGATRAEIAQVSLATAQAIVSLTAESLWPNETEPTPLGEEMLAQAFTDALATLEDSAKQTGHQA